MKFKKLLAAITVAACTTCINFSGGVQQVAVNAEKYSDTLTYLAMKTVNLLPYKSDFNGDGKINVRDAAAIANALAKGLI